MRVLLGNVAIARGIVEAGCHFVASYPGTPSSEIVPGVVSYKKELDLNTYIEWSANEKIAFDNALAASLTGKRSAVAMKQVGLNVASDSLLSSAYTGVVGGMVIISCDDPGPHSSQTEQDSRFFAMFAKIPALDPSSPQEAKDMVKDAFELSEEFEIPVLLRPTIRVSHAKQLVRLDTPKVIPRRANFRKNPERWAATPRSRLLLHKRLNEILKRVEERFEEESRWNFELYSSKKAVLGIISSSVSFAIIRELIDELNLGEYVCLLKIGTPFPLPLKRVERFIRRHRRILIIEEPGPLIELQIGDRRRVSGRMSGHVPLEGELTPEVIYEILASVLRSENLKNLEKTRDEELEELIEGLSLPSRRPTLCAGCPERAAFFAIRKAFPKGIYPSDIGCYTLGLNLKAVDTVIDMGAGITLASGFYHAYAQDGKRIPIIATIGDSTFYHSGPSGLLNAVYNDSRFILVILDNEITAMTGMQPTPGLGVRADQSAGKRVPLEDLVKGCGVGWLRVIDPYDVRNMVEVLKEADKYTRREDGGIAVIIARHPCLINYPESLKGKKVRVKITEECNGCGYCLEFFECPALKMDDEEKRVEIDRGLCVDCGVCVNSCLKGAIIEA